MVTTRFRSLYISNTRADSIGECLHLLHHRPMLLALSTVSVACLALLATPVVSASLVPTIPNYFCYGDAVVAWNLIVYFGTNYFLHAAAVLSSIDIGRYTERVTRRDACRWRI